MDKRLLYFAFGALIIVITFIIYKTIYTKPPVTTITPLTGNPYHTDSEFSGMKVSVHIPPGWKISSKEDNSVQQYAPMVIKSLNVYTVPSEITSDPQQTYWGGFIINIYKKESLDEWFSQFLSLPLQGVTSVNQRSYYTTIQITLGNKQANEIELINSAPKDLLVNITPHYIVQGTYYTYDLTFFQNSDIKANQRIIKEIFPTLLFQ